MSLRAVLPIAAIGGLAYFFHSKEKKGEKTESQEEDLDPLEELVREKGEDK